MKIPTKGKTRYYCEADSLAVPKSFLADSDEQALELMKKDVPDAIILYTEAEYGIFKTIWELSYEKCR